MKHSRLAYLLCGVAVGSLVACGGGSDSPASSNSASASTSVTAETPAAPVSARSAADKIRSAVPEVKDLIDLTEDNDANNLIGRPNGYSTATVLVDSRLQCDTATPGVDCGATVEQWSNESAAQKRSDYVKQIRESAPALGQEWTTVNGNLVLRVTGLLKPSVAKAYAAAFTD